jgi:hypothetical protein
MANIIKPDCFNPQYLSKVEMTRQFLKECIRLMESHLDKARADKNQNAVEIILDQLMKTRGMLRDMQTDPVTS